MPVKNLQTFLNQDSQETRRQSIRCAVNGIVALANFEKPVVTNILKTRGEFGATDDLTFGFFCLLPKTPH